MGVYSASASEYRTMVASTPDLTVDSTTNPTGMYADLATATTQATINDIRLTLSPT